jgi:hypothetical protein
MISGRFEVNTTSFDGSNQLEEGEPEFEMATLTPSLKIAVVTRFEVDPTTPENVELDEGLI